MVSAKLKNKLDDRASPEVISSQQGLAVFGIGLLTIVGLTSLIMGLDWQGYIAQPIAFIGSKAILVVQGPEPSLVATGYVFPPLMIYVSAILRSPVTLQVFSGALLVGVVIRAMGKLRVSRFWQAIWTVLILLHPALSFMLLRSPIWIATTLLLWVTIRLLWQMIQPEKLPLSFLVVLVGLTISGIMLLRFEAWLGLLYILGTLWCLLLEETWQYRVSALFIVFTMSLFSIGTCLYLNWLATDNPLAFLSQSGSGIRLPGMDSFFVQAGLWEGILKSNSWMFQVVPIYMLLIVWLIWRDRFHLQVGLILTVPIVLMLINLWQGFYTPNLAQCGVYLVLMPLLLGQLPLVQSRWKLLITLGLTASLLSSGWLLQQNQAIPDESLLWRQLTHQALPEFQPVQQLHQKSIDQRKITTFLSQNRQPPQHILMDDRLHFSILYLLQYTEGLILPHQYEFYVALEHPQQWVDFIVVAGAGSTLRTQDEVRRQLIQQMGADPESEETLTLPGFHTVFDSPDYQVLQRSLS